MAIFPPGALGVPTGAPPPYRDPDQELFESLLTRPIKPVNFTAPGNSKIVLGKPCLLVGYSCAETTGLAPASFALYDGADTTGTRLAFIQIPQPSTTETPATLTDTDSTSNTAASANTVTLAGVAAQTTYITGWELTGLGATAAALLTITVAGVLGGSKIYYHACPAGVGIEIAPLLVEYPRPIPASAVNTAITVTCSSPGSGNTNISLTAHGYQLAPGVTSAVSAISDNHTFPAPGILCRGGIYINKVSGTILGVFYVRA